MSARKVTPPRPLPALADGSTPVPEQRVVTPSGAHGRIVWSTYAEDSRTWHSLVTHDPGHVVSIDMGAGAIPVEPTTIVSLRYPTADLAQEVTP